MRSTLKLRKPYIATGLLFLIALAFGGCSGSESKVANGMQMIQQLDYEGALMDFDAAQEKGENSRLIARGRGIAYMGMTDYEQAINCFLEALADSDGFIQPIDYDLNYYLAAAYIKNGQYTEAEETYDAILTLKTEEEDAYFLRGNVRLERGDFDGAKADFDKVVSMDAENYDRLIEIYEALEHHGFREAGQEYLYSAIEKSGGKMGNYHIGRMYYYLGDYQQACLALEKARDKDKGDAEVYLYLGRAYEATGDYNYAASVYNSWMAKDTASAEIYNQLGLCEMQRGDYQSALTAIQAGMQTENNEMMQILSFNEIVAYEHLMDYKKASVLLDNYLKNYPDDEVAKREQVFLSTR